MWGYTRGLFGYRGDRRDAVPPELGILEEDVGMAVGLEGIDWVEIITIDTSAEEDVGMAVGLEGITWEEEE